MDRWRNEGKFYRIDEILKDLQDYFFRVMSLIQHQKVIL